MSKYALKSQDYYFHWGGYYVGNTYALYRWYRNIVPGV